MHTEFGKRLPASWLVVLGLMLSAESPAEPTPARPCALTDLLLADDHACLGRARSVLGRTYCVHVPASAEVGLPVVLLLHGYSTNGQSQANYFDLDSAVDRRRFILVKPNGTADSEGALYWAAGFRFLPSRPDDVAYLTAVLQDVVTAFGADTSRVFVIGYSNGAFMANRLACQRSDRIAAMVSVAGAVPQGCQPAQPVSVLTVHGTADPAVRYQGGGLGLDPIGPYASADATLAAWANADGCSGQRAPGKPLRLTCGGTGADTTVFTYLGCPPGISVEHWRLDRLDHEPNFALPAWPDALLDFLWAHPKPPVRREAR